MENTIEINRKEEIRKRKRQFLAFCLAFILGLMPAATVWADAISFKSSEAEAQVGKTINKDETITCTVSASGGTLIITYDSGVEQDKQSRGDEGPVEIKAKGCSTEGFKCWKVSEGINRPEMYETELKLTAVIEKEEPEEPEEPKKKKKKKVQYNKKNNNTAEEEEEWEDPAKLNPDALAAFYYKNGLLDTRAKFGKQEQGTACTAAFDLARPYGWKTAFSFSMTYDDKHTYSMKDGTLILGIPGQNQKSGRQYAVMAIDKNAVVHLYPNKGDTVKTPYIFTNKLDLEGYAFCLIYKD